MGTALVKMKIMPTAPGVDLNKITEDAKKIIESKKVLNPVFEQQPIAFGLIAVIAGFAWPEENELEDLEQELRTIENVNSVEVIDLRRAIG